MQLIVYAAVVSTNMPSNLYYFLINYLQLLRLNLGEVSAFNLGYIEGSDVMNLGSSSDTYLSPLLLMSGYRYPVQLNIYAFYAIITCLLLASLVVYVRDRCRVGHE